MVAGREGPVRNSVLPEHLADLHNFIGLNSRYSIFTPSVFLNTQFSHFVYTDIIKEKRHIGNSDTRRGSTGESETCLRDK